MAAKAVETKKPPVDEAIVKKAIADGKALMKDGSSKIDAAMVIYRQLEAQPQEVTVRALIDGASLTDKGALTYWYTCRRRLTKERNDTKPG